MVPRNIVGGFVDLVHALEEGFGAVARRAIRAEAARTANGSAVPEVALREAGRYRRFEL
jgi:hypothetical protein